VIILKMGKPKPKVEKPSDPGGIKRKSKEEPLAFINTKIKKMGRSTSQSTSKSYHSCSDSNSSKMDTQDITQHVVSSDSKIKSRKPLILDLKQHNTIEIRKQIDSLNLSNKFFYKTKKDNQLFVITQTKEDKNKVTEFLKSTKGEKKIEFHTFTDADVKTKIFVLKNFFYQTTDEMLVVLKNSGIPATKVSYLRNNQHDPYYLVHFEKGKISLAALNTQHRAIEHCIVKWEKLKTLNKKISQCHNCQRFGHTSSNCGHAYRCVKCTNSHKPTECQRTTRDENVKCVNCNGDHSANSKVCKFYIDYIKKIEHFKTSKTFKPKPKTFVSTPAPWATITDNLIELPPLSPSDRIEYFQNSQSNTKPSISISNQNCNLNTFSRLSQEFNNIENIKETMNLYKELIDKLKATSCQKTRLSILMEYTLP
jgi:hypothetical protein